MRVSFGLLFALIASSVASAEETVVPKTPEQTGVTVNLDALDETPPVEIAPPVPPGKPKPRAKPNPVEVSSGVPVPRHKPALQDAANVPAAEPIETAKPTPVEPVPAQTAAVKPDASPKVPVTIVEDFPVEMRGVRSDPFASTKPYNPVAGFSVVSRIRFANGATQLGNNARAVLDAVAERLLANTERVRLAAFSGKAGDMSSEARRLSLERATLVRQYLVSKGVPQERVDMLPFGGATDGITDRVDVLTSGT